MVLLVTVTFGKLNSTHGPPQVQQIVVYAVGGVMTFTILEGMLSAGFVGLCRITPLRS